MPTPTHALICDLETTDSEPHLQHAAILEVGAILCRWEPELPEVARASLVIRPAGTLGDHDVMWAQMPQVVRDMHTANGLWEEATIGPDAWNVTEADTAIARWLVTHAGADAVVALAGSGTSHLDHPFIKAHLPRLASRIGAYWTLDIGPFRRMLGLAGRADLLDLAGDVNAKPHRGLGDAELHLAEARRYLGLLQSIPQITAAQPSA